MVLGPLILAISLLGAQHEPVQQPIKCGSHGTDAFHITFSDWVQVKRILLSHDEKRISVLISKKGIYRVAIINGQPSKTHLSKEAFLSRIHIDQPGGLSAGKPSAPDHVFGTTWNALHDVVNKERIGSDNATISSGQNYAVIRFFDEEGYLRILSIKATVDR